MAIDNDQRYYKNIVLPFENFETFQFIFICESNSKIGTL